ncbi:MAG TPA: ferredoxin family protein [Polyangiaceae bacterium]|nr:ferredoxin family protein [Polyangiaceae bacterium]
MNEAQCRERGRVRPVVDLAECGGKAACVRVCPHAVFEIRVLDAAERAALPWYARLKSFVRGHRKAFVVRAEDCHACGLCVTACPEHAIDLRGAGDASRR